MGDLFVLVISCIFINNILLAQYLGNCPFLGTSKKMETAIGMAMAVIFVLVCSNLFISLLRNIIPSKVRIACFIVIVATFVTIVELMMQAYAYELFLTLGIFIPLIVVNCIPLGRAEAFAYKNGPLLSIADGLGLGIGYGLSLSALASVRELLGNGTLTVWGGIPAFTMGPDFLPFKFLLTAPGAFVGLGLMLCLMNLIGKK